VQCFFDLTGGGWDTAALVTAGKMQATGADIRVISTGGSVFSNDYWLADINTDHTKIWVWLGCYPTPFNMTLSANIANSGSVATITGVLSGTLGTVPTNGTIVIDNELFTYSAFNATTNTFTITTRAAKGSSMAAHTTADKIYLIPSDIWITYGDLGAVAPTVTESPLPIDLSTSTNTSWVFVDDFGSKSNNLLPGFLSSVKYTNKGGTYYSGVHGTNIDPRDVVGVKTTSYTSGNVIVSDPQGGGLWQFLLPMGVTHIAATGEKYKSLSAYWPSTCRLYFSTYLGNQQTATPYDIADPSAAETWEAISTGTIDLGGSTTKNIVFIMRGSLGTTAPLPYAYVELSEITFTLNSAGTFQIISGTATEVENYQLAPTIRNTTLSQSIILDVTAAVGNKITIDTDNQLIYSADGKRVRSMLSIDAPRDEWMQFQTGNNTISYVDADSGAVTFVTKWRGRNTI